MNKFTKLAIAVAIASSTTTSAYAASFSPFKIDVDQTSFAGADVSVTEIMDFIGLSYVINTFSNANDFTFKNNGVYKISGTDDQAGQNEFNGKEITAKFTNGTGVGKLTSGISFLTGQIEFFADSAKDYGTANGIYGADNGTSLGSFDLISGTGNIDPVSAVPNGAITLIFQAKNLPINTWFDMYGNDLSFNPEVFSFVTNNASRLATSTNLIAQEVVCQLNSYNCPTGRPFDSLPTNFLLSNNGQHRLSVPEPGSLALIGMGLLALSSLRKRLGFTG
jgi:hypothetical protein